MCVCLAVHVCVSLCVRVSFCVRISVCVTSPFIVVMRIQIYIDIVKVKIFAAATPYTYFLPPPRTHIDPLAAYKGGKAKWVRAVPCPIPATPFLLLTPQRQSHMQCQYLYLLSMRVARKWRLPFVGFPLPLGPPSLLRCGFFFAILSFTIWGLCGH